MPKAKDYCGLQAGHSRKCMTPKAVKHHFEQQAKYVLARRVERRAIIAAIKLESGCVDCGYNANAEALEFDHLGDVPKVANIAEMTDLRWSRVLDEIAKCVVRCAICHRLKTQERRKPGSHDGTGLSA